MMLTWKLITGLFNIWSTDFKELSSGPFIDFFHESKSKFNVWMVNKPKIIFRCFICVAVRAFIIFYFQWTNGNHCYLLFSLVIVRIIYRFSLSTTRYSVFFIYINALTIDSRATQLDSVNHLVTAILGSFACPMKQT